jgi:PBP1b-binding outer membrane lipoprotein LpoB
MKKLIYSIAIICLLLVTLVSCTTEEIETYNSTQDNTNVSSTSRDNVEPILMPSKPR